MSLRVYRSVKAVTGAAKALFWKISETQNFTYLTISKHQNTKTSLNKLSKNHGVIAIFEIFGSVRRKLQFTVFNDHPVLQTVIIRIFLVIAIMTIYSSSICVQHISEQWLLN